MNSGKSKAFDKNAVIRIKKRLNIALDDPSDSLIEQTIKVCDSLRRLWHIAIYDLEKYELRG
jgi:hypothetical protein